MRWKPSSTSSSCLKREAYWLREQLTLLALGKVGLAPPRSKSSGPCSRRGRIVPRICRPQRLSVRALDNRSRSTTRIMGVAFKMTRIALGIAERRRDVNEIVAKTIVELTKQGERNLDLCDFSAARSQRSGASAVHQVQRFKGSIGSTILTVLASAHVTVIPLSSPPHQVQTDASVTNRPLILTPAQRVSHT
jgi:hypothetical protein